MKKNKEIEQRKIILVEGIDAYFFCIWAYQIYGRNDIQVLDFGGIAELSGYLKTLQALPNFNIVDTLVIVRDAETNPTSAAQSIATSLGNANLSVPGAHCEFAGNNPRVGYFIFPGENAQGTQLRNGTLEDLCLGTVANDAIFECIESYVNCVTAKGNTVTHPHKTRLHTYLAGKSAFVGLKIGEAARAGAWDWNHQSLAKFRSLILAM